MTEPRNWQLGAGDFTRDQATSGSGSMPRISQFYGIAIYMYYRDHVPPHFHAIYGEYDAEFEISSAQVIEGDMPRRARSLVTEWAHLHRDELQTNWTLARTAQPLNPIDPLP